MPSDRTTAILEKNLARNEQLAILNHIIKDIENGESFFYNEADTLTTTASPLYYSFRTNGLKTVYFIGAVVGSLGGQLKIEIFENSTITDATGTILTCRNKNRQLPDTCDIVLKKAPTVTVDGTLLSTLYAGAGSNPGKAETGQTTSDLDPTILKGETNYILKITNEAGADLDFSMIIRWNERD